VCLVLCVFGVVCVWCFVSEGEEKSVVCGVWCVLRAIVARCVRLLRVACCVLLLCDVCDVVIRVV
jgi:hypothetical protein